MTFGDNLKRARIEKGLTQKQVAEKSGIVERQYQYYETSKRVPNVLIAKRLANAIGCTLDSLTDDCTLV